MRKTKHIMAAILAAMLTLSLAACKDNSGPNPDGTSLPPNASNPPAQTTADSSAAPAPMHTPGSGDVEQYYDDGKGPDEVVDPMFDSIMAVDPAKDNSLASLEHLDDMTLMRYSGTGHTSDHVTVWTANLTVTHALNNDLGAEMQNALYEAYGSMQNQYGREKLVAGGQTENFFAFEIDTEDTVEIYYVRVENNTTYELHVKDYTDRGLTAAVKRANVIFDAIGRLDLSL